MNQSNKIQIEFLPNNHTFKTRKGERSQREVFMYLRTRIKPNDVIYIFFENPCHKTAFHFSKHPDDYIQMQDRLKNTNPLQYNRNSEQILALEPLHRYIMNVLNGQVNIHYIPVPCFGEQASKQVIQKLKESKQNYLKNIIELFDQYELIKEYKDSIKDLFQSTTSRCMDTGLVDYLEEIEYNIVDFMDGLLEIDLPDELLPFQYPNTLSKKAQKEFEEELITRILQTETFNGREYMTLKEIAIILRTIPNARSKNHKYFLMFGSDHQFDLWNERLRGMEFVRVNLKIDSHYINFPHDKYPYFNYRRKSIVDFVDRLEREHEDRVNQRKYYKTTSPQE
jgi:hypothetical protein